MNYTGKRLNDLENETTGEGARVISVVGGWTVVSYPNGEKVASVGIDYNKNIDYIWDEHSFTIINEVIPNSIFTNVDSVECMPLDITSGTTYKSSILAVRKSLFSVINTGNFTLQSLEYSFGDPNYNLPEKIHIVWTVKGN